MESKNLAIEEAEEAEIGGGMGQQEHMVGEKN